MNLPLTINAFEFGKSLVMLGGRPICNAFAKSTAFTVFVPAMILPPFVSDTSVELELVESVGKS
jgi:hypothetical protein